MLEQVGKPVGQLRRRPRQLRRPGWVSGISRLREDTGFEPGYGTPAAIADYIRWLRSGHER